MTDSTGPHKKQGGNNQPEIFRSMRNLGIDPEIVGCIQDAQEVLAFELPASERESFLLFHAFITSPQPTFITEWRASPTDERWYRALVDGLNWATRNAYAAVLYHFQNLCRLESEVMERISRRNYVRALGNSAVGIGNTAKWDFEYQAFVFAYRRSLDYLARGLAAFFKQQFHSLHRKNFSFVISAGDKRSVRDKIAHYEWVQAGTINLNRYGFLLMGGGEVLPFTMAHNTARLADTLGMRVGMLKACIDEMLTVFVTEARAWDVSRSPKSMR